MTNPFPGMNPYLESADIWTEVHSKFIPCIADILNTSLPSNYYAGVELRCYIEIPKRDIVPDVLVFDRPNTLLNLQEVFDTFYGRGRYNSRINYQCDPVPSLKSEDTKWADTLLKEKGLR